ncbi:hypothetical protein AWW66_07605 [Micromonospora rosaria]|uniref:Uncharacterized protein n=1 Tax=Micromonospora rosaria TaxID=47874 RepID=A0A136PVV8_9ACTN|nr:hypothetical protein AWW66_07605 [Micromonospora rosaria]
MLDEEFSSGDRVALLVHLIAVEPLPPVVGRPVEDPDQAEHDRGGELDAGGPGEMEQVTGPEFGYRWRYRRHAVIRVRATLTSRHQSLSVQCGQR